MQGVPLSLLRLLPATGRAPVAVTSNVSLPVLTLPATGLGPRFAAFELPGKGIVNSLKEFFVPQSEPGKPVLRPIIPTDVVLTTLVGLRALLGRERFVQGLKTLGKFAVGGSIPEALVGLGATEALQPLDDIAKAVKALFLPHKPVEFKSQLFTDQVLDVLDVGNPPRRFEERPDIAAMRADFDRQRGVRSLDIGALVATIQRGAVGTATAPTGQVPTDLQGRLNAQRLRHDRQWFDESNRARLFDAQGSAGAPLPGEKGDP